jgi:hypothetical protein
VWLREGRRRVRVRQVCVKYILSCSFYCDNYEVASPLPTGQVLTVTSPVKRRKRPTTKTWSAAQRRAEAGLTPMRSNTSSCPGAIHVLSPTLRTGRYKTVELLCCYQGLTRQTTRSPSWVTSSTGTSATTASEPEVLLPLEGFVAVEAYL